MSGKAQGKSTTKKEKKRMTRKSTLGFLKCKRQRAEVAECNHRHYHHRTRIPTQIGVIKEMEMETGLDTPRRVSPHPPFQVAVLGRFKMSH